MKKLNYIVFVLFVLGYISYRTIIINSLESNNSHSEGDTEDNESDDNDEQPVSDDNDEQPVSDDNDEQPVSDDNDEQPGSDDIDEQPGSGDNINNDQSWNDGHFYPEIGIIQNKILFYGHIVNKSKYVYLFDNDTLETAMNFVDFKEDSNIGKLHSDYKNVELVDGLVIHVYKKNTFYIEGCMKYNFNLEFSVGDKLKQYKSILIINSLPNTDLDKIDYDLVLIDNETLKIECIN